MKKLSLILTSLALVSTIASAQSNYTYGATSIKENITATARQSGIGAASSVVISSSVNKLTTIPTVSPFVATSGVDSTYNQMMYSVGTNIDSFATNTTSGYITTVAKTGTGSNTSFYTGLNSVVDGGLGGSADGIRYNSSSSKGMGGVFVIKKSAIGSIGVSQLSTGHTSTTDTKVSTLVNSTPLTVDSIQLTPFTFKGKSEITVNLQNDTSAQ
jgi:hypothetical protein